MTCSRWVTRINNAKDVQELVRLYDKLNRTVLLCSRVPVITFDQAAGECYQQLLLDVPALAKKRLQKDVRIAAIALSLNAVAVTRNHQDFSQISGLQLDNWTE
ncbi:MAG: type II toxin-antitoxin system VapC family toxin [Thainema sp.]